MYEYSRTAKPSSLTTAGLPLPNRRIYGPIITKPGGKVPTNHSLELLVYNHFNQNGSHSFTKEIDNFDF